MFYATNHANQADVNTLTKMSPFLVTIFASVFLKEKISKIQVPAMVVALIGCIIVANPTFNSNLFPLFIAFLNAVTSAVAYTLLSYFKDKVEGVSVIMHFSTFSVVTAGVLMIKGFVMPTPVDWCLLLLIGIFGAFGQICLTYAYRMAPAAEVSVYNYSGIVFSMILGYVVLDQSLGFNSILGALLVVAASVMVYLYNNRKKVKS
jgi:drug/metabolite transporter (DMT)-like permease